MISLANHGKRWDLGVGTVDGAEIVGQFFVLLLVVQSVLQSKEFTL